MDTNNSTKGSKGNEKEKKETPALTGWNAVRKQGALAGQLDEEKQRRIGS